MMEQIERIQYYEEILDDAEMTIRQLSDALARYRALESKIKELECYYESPLWMKDYQDDEAGKIPSDLKRGVLSQDAVYDVLSDIARIEKELVKPGSKECSKEII